MRLAVFLAVLSTTLSAQPPAPDPLIHEDGTAVDTAAAWQAQRRPELLALFADHVYGRMPAPPEAVRVVARGEHAGEDGSRLRTLRVTWDAPHGEAGFDLLLALPAQHEAPLPVLLGLNFYGNHAVVDDARVPLARGWLPARAAGVVDHHATEVARGTAAARWPIAQRTARGFAVATLYHGDLAPDDPELAFRAEHGLHALYHGPERERPGNGWGALAMWAFGLSRAREALGGLPEIDADRIVVVGHSRNGKAALLAGATDPGFAAVVSNQSGCGGAALSRRRQGETVAAINRRFPHWFCPAFRRYDDDEAALPVDQHLLLALCAPRPVLVCSAAADAWADPEGERAAVRGAAPVYRLLAAGDVAAAAAPGMPEPGVLLPGPLGYHVRPGPHGVGAEDWAVFAAFAAAELPDVRAR